MNSKFDVILAKYLLAEPDRIKILKALWDEAASGAQPPEAVSPSATGCRGATAPSNPEADSSVRCRDKAEPAAKLEQFTAYNAEIKFDLQGIRWDLLKAILNPFASNLTILMDKCPVQIRKIAAGAPPCGERARLDNGELCRVRKTE